ncbi:glycosyltransferase family 2 protein [Roseisolibacter sp. H3M3-2]|uniref:glycosyltransferase family 2 protein n=1 Tax=Roseisolibacter sp. H3M3-2 TaxID=3031323 RepID=UPI0023DC86FA|nr:glycosyltransferase family 2 protein [Roseisolibacter sp. H3M3-2]MDF1504578.1 glycosyltransferase family 2 protein [Roseisolibacter sp. H3M3-2]
MATLSVVMPAYNEAAHIERSVSEWHDGVVAAVPGAELVVVDDCSTDDTGARLAALAERLPALRVLRTPRNAGHGPALRLALEQCAGEWVFQTDSDRQHAPDDFWALWERRDAADFVFGVRDARADGAFRALVSGVLRLVNLAVWQRWVRDANCPFKLMRRRALEPILVRIPRDAFIPMVMIAILARRGDARVREVRVRHFARRAGHQSLAGLLTWARIGRRCVRELLALRAAERRRAAKSDRSHVVL